MYISRVGGVIAAASKKDAVPLLQVGSISIVKRTVISFQQAGVFPIVIVTGIDEEEVKYQLAPSASFSSARMLREPAALRLGPYRASATCRTSAIKSFSRRSTCPCSRRAH
jgi:hypothetical protein